MESNILAWSLFLTYVLVTFALAFIGMKKTKGFKSFALGGDMGPVLVGITLAASIASSATFVINPGFVYTHGLSGFIHFAIASPLGFLTALIVFSKGFREMGLKSGALTLPDWVKRRYNSPGLGSYFAILNLFLSITFVVLIVKGSALVMQATLGLEYFWSLVVIVGVVFSYIMIGGTYAHAYTNSLQGVMMVGIALLMIFSGAEHFSGGLGGFMAKLSAIDPNLTKAFNPESALFSNFWNVFLCSFIVGLGIVCQPHILLKALYLRSDKDLKPYLIVGSLVSIVFAGILIVGFYARIEMPVLAGQDAIVAKYISGAFSSFIGIFVSIALLAAGMSTLDGILVGASSIAANDIFLGPVGEKLFPKWSRADREEKALSASRWILLFMGVGAFLLALDPPKLVGLFAQAGIYGLIAASIIPFGLGILLRKYELSKTAVITASVVGPLIHFVIYLYYTQVLGEVLNPAVSASIGIAMALLSFTLVQLSTVKGLIPLKQQN